MRMGSDLHLSPPSEAVTRLVHGSGWTALYSRQTDGIYGRDRVETWHRDYLVHDPTLLAAEVLSSTRNLKVLERDDLFNNEDLHNPLPKALPRSVLEAQTPLEVKRGQLEAELQAVNERIADGHEE